MNQSKSCTNTFGSEKQRRLPEYETSATIKIREKVVRLIDEENNQLGSTYDEKLLQRCAPVKSEIRNDKSARLTIKFLWHFWSERDLSPEKEEIQYEW